MTARPLACFVAASFAVWCGPRVSRQSTLEVDLDLHRVLPDTAALAGWSVAEGPADYSPADLYQVLDGGAERYLGYGFRRLLRVRYESKQEPGLSVTLDLFDMGSELGAFGIYSSGRPLDGAFERWGVEGYRSGSVAAAWKGRLFAHAEADEERAPLLEMAGRLLGDACARVPGPERWPSVLAALPPEGLVPHSERWIAADLLGHECLPGGVLASYSGEGGRGELFFSDLVNRGAAAAALAELRAHYLRTGATVGAAPPIGPAGFSFRDPSLGLGSAVASGRFVAGIYGSLSPKAQQRILAELVARLPAR
jgi:hypothetical protein